MRLLGSGSLEEAGKLIDRGLNTVGHRSREETANLKRRGGSQCRNGDVECGHALV
jgi:hypothetical protein